jgi:transcription antitermination factor NusG
MSERNNLYWYALQCGTGHEMTARRWFARLFPEYGTLLPRRMLHIRKSGKTRLLTKALFSGYFFMHTETPLETYRTQEILRKINIGLYPIVYRILGRKDTETITHVHPDEMDLILELTAGGEEIGLTSIAREGNIFRVLSGPLKGKDVLIKKIHPRKKRITVELNLLGQKHVINLGADVLMEPIR